MNTLNEDVGFASSPGEVTRLLRAWNSGSSEAHEELWSLLYGELKRLAASVLRDKERGAEHDATSLVHKAYVRLLGSDVKWNDRRHFFAIAARAMRFVLADQARRQMTSKRGADTTLQMDDTLREVADPLAQRPDEVLAVHEALKKLTEIQPRQAQLVELRYFAGLSVEESAKILDVTTRTVVRDWKGVRVWLHSELRTAV